MTTPLDTARAFDSGTAWAEWQGHFEKLLADGQRTRSYRTDTIDSLSNSNLKLYATDWKIELPPFKTWPTVNPNGHNWRNVARIDFSFWPSFSPFRWSGHLLTSGDNPTFRFHRRRDFVFASQKWNVKPSSCTLHDFDGIPYWHAVFPKGKDLFVMSRDQSHQWGTLGWISAQTPELLAATFVRERLGKAA